MTASTTRCPRSAAVATAADEPLARPADHRAGAGARVLRAVDVRRASTPTGSGSTPSGYGCVFSKLFWTRTGLFLVFGAADGGCRRRQHVPRLPASGRSSGRTRPSRPTSSATARSSRPIRGWLLVGVSVVIGALRRHLRDRGVAHLPAVAQPQCRSASADPYFHKDIGFYVFEPALAALPGRLRDGGRWSSRCSPRRSCTTCTAASGCSRRGDRLSGAAQVQLSVLLGLFVLAQGASTTGSTASTWPPRPAALITGMTYTDDHAVLPAKNILIGHRGDLRGAVLRSTSGGAPGCCPSVGLALLVLSAILLGDDLAGHRAAVPGQARPSRTRRRRTSRRTSQATRAAYDLEDIDVSEYDADGPALTAAAAQTPTPTRRRHPAGRPAAGARDLRADPAGARLLLASPTCSTSTATTIDGTRPRARARRPRAATRAACPTTPAELVQPAHRLHPRQRHDRGVRQPARRRRTSRSNNDGEPVAPRRTCRRPGEISDVQPDRKYRAADLLRRAQPRLLRSSARRPGGKDVELDLPQGSGTTASRRPTTYDGKGGVPRRQHVPQAAVRREVRRRQLPALRAGQREQQDPLQPHPARAGAEGRAVADRRLRRLPGGRRRQDRLDPRRLHDHRPATRCAEKESLQDDDRRRAQPAPAYCRRCRPTRSTTCATRSRPRSTPTTAR